MRVPAGLYVPMLVTEIDAHGQAAWDRNEALIKRLARIDSLTHADELPKGTISIAAPGASFGLPLSDIIDIGAEKERLEKAKGKLAKELGGLRGRLNNPKFVASAPEDLSPAAGETDPPAADPILPSLEAEPAAPEAELSLPEVVRSSIE